MTQKILRGTVMFTALQLALTAAAYAKTDPMRCAAKTLRRQSHFYECLAGCDRRTAAQSSKAADVLQTRQTRCEAGCDERNSRKVEDIKSKPPCKDIVKTPNPRACEARYLEAEASYMVCLSRCPDRADPATCQTTCTTRYETDLDQVKAEPVCSEGPINAPLSPDSF